MALWLCRGFFRVFICNFASRKTLIGGLRFLLCVYKSPFRGLECGIYHVESVKMTKKSILRDQFSWKVRTFAQNLCENGLHLGKERALCTRFAPSLSHVFSQRHHFILLNYPTELRPRKGFNEQIQMYIEAALHSADFNHSTFGAVAGLVGYMGRGLRFLYAHTDSASPYQTLMREL